MTLSDSTELRSEATHPAVDPHASHVASRLNWLRAGVLGANDGIVSTAGLVVGVAAATTTLTGTVSAILGGSRRGRAVFRVVLGGALAMLVTYGIGQMVGMTI
jgi:VIT1/CCC1 family predicted Fe2+/Mn2+ transporter